MTFDQFIHQFIDNLQHTTWYEYLAVVSGIVSVWYSRKENVLVYPTGLVNTVIYIYISIAGNLPGEATVNLYYTIMSIIGWYMWTKKDRSNHVILHITSSSPKDWLQQLLFFGVFYAAIFFSLHYLKGAFFPGAIPWADALASSTAFTGMWLMTKKKVESWYWWIITNLCSIPLYFVKGYAFTSIYYVILFVMAVFGLIEWIRREKEEKKSPTDQHR